MDFAKLRAEMVNDLSNRGIRDTAVLQAMNTVPREQFVQEGYEEFAYYNGALPLPAKQTISQPYVVALMLSALKLQPQFNVLEIGTGSGYAAAVVAQMVRQVHTVERQEALVDYAKVRLQQLGYANIGVHLGDGTLGWPEAAPYDAIVVAAGGPTVPVSLREQLGVNGRLIMPVGSYKKQKLQLVWRKKNGRFGQKTLTPVRFVPLIGSEGWENGDQ
ncbi:protein-L-isoaspartate(D-aspartate) O-methyltransferase [Candidatus Leptofilum sp.]|uniref:protein-L-isoaspartate(D-aspartate) O-methyltransferase n=1 Tax=Candidatus Leptofilum sp. TaxID=3241576 RepID=UPI003B595967